MAGRLNVLPEWMRSVRFRITILYSTVLFVLAAVLVAALYLALLSTLRHEPSFTRITDYSADINGDGVSQPSERLLITDLRSFQRAANETTLKNMREYVLGALGVLFLVSLGVGWVISGRVLSPIGRITDVADHIQATDLSQRIELHGPQDELKRLADTFDGMLARLDAAFAVQSRFIADASHELRNPLAVIRTNVDVVLSDPHATTDDWRQTAFVVRRATDRMGRLVDDLFALARLESPNMRSDRLDLSALASEVADEFGAVAGAKDVTINKSLGESLIVAGDGDALKRALANLLDNALKSAPPGSSIGVDAGLRERWAWVALRDHGEGISSEDQTRIFDRFWRKDSSRSRSSGGSGLGLSIVRGIAESHSGSVGVSSQPGRGAVFVLWIPLAGEPPGEPPPDWVPGASGAASARQVPA
ncbi:MAG: HAMP domain-containing histidine kinase [Actinobacteria bacterium]|nr:HAMP domain-containing histidine kinase [Actinomycetota bacterium]